MELFIEYLQRYFFSPQRNMDVNINTNMLSLMSHSGFKGGNLTPCDVVRINNQRK